MPRRPSASRAAALPVAPLLVRLALPLLALGLLAVTALSARAEDNPFPRTVAVSATGTVMAKPDYATISTGVATEAPTAGEAVAANTAAMTKVIETLKSSGIDAKDLQTSDFSVQPRYEYTQDGKPPKLVGYAVTNQLVIRVNDLTNLGALLDQVVQAGSNQISGISFGVSRDEVLRDQARRDAMANALRMAKLYAEAADAELGKVVSIQEGGGYVGPRPMPYAKAAMAEAAPVPIETGQQSLEVRIDVVWELK